MRPEWDLWYTKGRGLSKEGEGFSYFPKGPGDLTRHGTDFLNPALKTGQSLRADHFLYCPLLGLSDSAVARRSVPHVCIT